jgi:solute:Na+ symporter, SSS family
MDPLVYSYAVGGVVYCAGLVFAVKQGYINFTASGIRNLLICLFVPAFFLTIQGYLQYAPMETAPKMPYSGVADDVIDSASRVRGQPIDYAIMIGYFLLILAVGTWFGRRQKTTKDFFFGGQRFSWWLIAFSLIATTVGSYSFVKYSLMGYKYGLASSQTYLNDWIWFPLLAFGWLPILYFSRVTSIPEYFSRRFGAGVRSWATFYILIYLIGYVGVNLFTMGKVLNGLIGWEILTGAAVVAVISATYVTAGGQTSVIMTDLLQGVMLLITGLIILVLGIDYLGGFGIFWDNLPREYRLAFANFNAKPDFPSVGIFWQDAVANSAMLYFLNQGIAMRFLAARSLSESRKAVFAVVVLLMTVGACVVASGGWTARALVHAGVLPDTIEPGQAFYIATEFLSRPGLFGLILAALTAALMSTVDTLITAVAAIVVNDVYRPYIRPDATDRQMLRAARISSVSVMILGVALVPVFMNFDSIYAAHGAFTAAVTPPLVVVLLLSVFWRRFTRTAAICTLVGGMVAIVASIFVPEIITPFAHGVPMTDVGDGMLAGMKQYKFMRAFYGIVVCGGIAVFVTLLTKPEPFERQRGLVWGTIADALKNYKGSPGDESIHRKTTAQPRQSAVEPARSGTAQLPVINLSRPAAEALHAKCGDLVYVSDRRWWFGGLRSTHAVVGAIDIDAEEAVVEIGPQTWQNVVTASRTDQLVSIERLY